MKSADEIGFSSGSDIPFFVTCAKSPEYDGSQDGLVKVGALKADLLLMLCLSA